MQYTLRDIPPVVDEQLRRRARLEGKSLNTVVVEALTRAVGAGSVKQKRRSLSDVAGSWSKDSAADDALKAQRKIDRELWK